MDQNIHKGLQISSVESFLHYRQLKRIIEHSLKQISKDSQLLG